MVFEGLSEKLQNLMKKMKGTVRVNEKDVKEMMREIKLALLETDVNFKVVKDLLIQCLKELSDKAFWKASLRGSK